MTPKQRIEAKYTGMAVPSAMRGGKGIYYGKLKKVHKSTNSNYVIIEFKNSTSVRLGKNTYKKLLSGELCKGRPMGSKTNQ